MPAILAVPPAGPYNGSLYPYGIANAAQAPPEGAMAVSASFAWPADGPSILVNIGQPGSVVSQICGLYVNNSGCSQPVNFYFSDTQYPLTVPAYSIGWYPVYTRLLQFTAYCLNTEAGDQTFIQVYNSLIQTPATGSIFNRGQSTSNDTLAFGAAGTLVSTVLFAGPCVVNNVCAGVGNVLANTAAFIGGIRIYDGATLMFSARIGLAASGFRDTALMIDLQGLSVRFSTNLTIGVLTIAPGVVPISGSAYFNIQFQPGAG